MGNRAVSRRGSRLRKDFRRILNQRLHDNKPRMMGMDVDSVDRWVRNGQKTLHIDVPADLQRRIKSECDREGVKIADVLRAMLEIRFPAEEGPQGR